MTHFHILSFSLEIVYIENIHKSWYTKWFYNALFCFLCKNPIILSCLLLMFRYQEVTGWRRDGARLTNTKFLALKTVQSFPCSGFNILAVPAPGPGPGPGLVYRPVPGPAPAWPCDIYTRLPSNDKSWIWDGPKQIGRYTCRIVLSFQDILCLKVQRPALKCYSIANTLHNWFIHVCDVCETSAV